MKQSHRKAKLKAIIRQYLHPKETPMQTTTPNPQPDPGQPQPPPQPPDEDE